MWTELLQIFRSNDPMRNMAGDFLKMLELTKEMAQIVRPHVLSNSLDFEQRRKVYKLDISVNKLERTVRKRVIAHLSLRNKGDVLHALLMMTLVKDVERVGDYIKNIAEVSELGGTALPEGEIRTELEDLVMIAHMMFEEVAPIISSQDNARAIELIEEGRNAGKRCDRLLVELSKSNMTPAETTATVLLTRFYKRIGAHLVNILSSVVMPLHKVDFFDEKELETTDTKEEAAS
tara:strand:+ start:621 stop:1322 length:702 start_codon:yes stop_codon:yes gene_type:complete